MAKTKPTTAPNKLFPPDIIAAARFAQGATGCPASVTLAQWALESGFGKYTPPGSNNYFGIKAKEGQAFVEVETKEVVHGKWIEEKAKFAKYATVELGFSAHAFLLTDPHGPYAAFLVYIHDVYKWVPRIATHYATDPKYSEKILSIISQYELVQYDLTK